MCQGLIFYNQLHMSQTLTDIINDIKPRRNHSLKRLTYSPRPSSTPYNNLEQSKTSCHQSCRHWTHQENTIFHNFLNTIGADFSLILGQLPCKTRKQIKKKYNKTESLRRRQMMLRRRLEKERRLTIFQSDILELPTSAVEQQTHKPKPNNPID